LLFLCFIGSGLHKYNAAMQMLGPPGMLASGFVVPSLPANAKRETNRETLERLELDLILIGGNWYVIGDQRTADGRCGAGRARSAPCYVLVRTYAVQNNLPPGEKLWRKASPLCCGRETTT